MRPVSVLAGGALITVLEPQQPDLGTGMWPALRTATAVACGAVTHAIGRLVGAVFILEATAFVAIATAAIATAAVTSGIVERSGPAGPRRMRQDPDVDDDELPRTGTCDLSTVGRRTGHSRRVEIWYVVVDGRIVVTGTPGARHWLANLRERPAAVLHLRGPDRDVTVTAEEVTDEAARRRVAAEAWRLQPWYAEQPYSVEDWVADSPMVMLTPAASDPGGAGREC